MSGADRVRQARVALGWFAESGNWQLWRRVTELGPVRVLEGLLAREVAQPLRPEPPLLGMGPAWQSPQHGAVDAWGLADAALGHAQRLAARVVIPEDDEWPAQLDCLTRVSGGGEGPVVRDGAPPLCLWVRGAGRLDTLLAQSVAVVGSRAATSYGAHAARQIGYGLAGAGWTVVSGGAFGIDAYAHRGALAAGGVTVAVLATGIDRAYPAGHANLFDRISEDGLLVSEWPVGTDPFRYRFLVRNRLIAGLTRGTVLVEAAARSGARQTFRLAGSLGRSRMVVPGPITSAMSVGCHEELRADPQARVVTGVPHILEEVGRLGTDLAPIPRGPQDIRDGLEPQERRLVEALLRRRPLSSQQLAARARVPLLEATRLLPSLVTRGLAARAEHGFVLGDRARQERRAADRLDTTTAAGGPSQDEPTGPGRAHRAAGADAGGGG